MFPPTDRPVPDDPSRADIGLVCALAMELDPFFDRCEHVRTIKGEGMRFRGGKLNSLRIAAVESGVGCDKARRATHALIDGHQPKWVLSVGFGGGLIDAVRVGDIVVADEVVIADRPDHQVLSIAHSMPPMPDKGLHVGRLVTGSRIVRTIEEKRELARQTSAVVCDMETHAVGMVCREREIPFMSIRGISDDLSADLPEEVHALMSAKSNARLAGATIGALWRRPESIKDMWALQGTASKVSKRLAPFLESVLVQLLSK